MPGEGVDWAGVSFLALGHHDGPMIRAPGLYGFGRRGAGGERVLLFIDHADCIASVAGPGHPVWAEALRLGMNELHICLKASARLDRLQLHDRVLKRIGPILNLLEQGEALAVPVALAALGIRGRRA